MKYQLILKLLTVTILFLLSSPALSHAKSVSSDPAARSVVSHSPKFISVLFNQQLEPSFSTLIVTNRKGKLVTEKKATVDPSNSKRLILTLPTLMAGEYTVSYKVLSLDGHIVKSNYTFRIDDKVPLAD